jgi:hypothetical protein
MSFDEKDHQAGRIMLLRLELSEPEFEDMGHILLLPRNSIEVVERVLQLLGVNDRRASLALAGSSAQESVSIVDFLTDSVDLYSHSASWTGWIRNSTTCLLSKTT